MESSLNTEKQHRVKQAYEFKRGKVTWYVWECICGTSSPLHQTQTAANDSYREHREKESALSATKGTET